MSLNEQITRDLRRALGDDTDRFDHVMRVTKMVKTLAERFGGDTEKLTTAALLHDITKNKDDAWQRETIRPVFGEAVLDAYPPPLYHAFTAMIVAREHYGIEDPDILLPIKHHTIGKPAMSLHEKVLFIADFSEPGRPYEASTAVRETAKYSLDDAVFEAMDRAIKVFEGGGTIPNLAYDAHRYYYSYTQGEKAPYGKTQND